MNPTPEELRKLRKGIRKRNLPHVFDNMWASEPGIGGVVFYADGKDFRVEWVVGASEKTKGRKKASFQELCDRPDLESVRLEVGWLIGDLLSHQASAIMASIGGPDEAVRESQPLRNAAAEWRHWALVPAGHMTK